MKYYFHKNTFWTDKCEYFKQEGGPCDLLYTFGNNHGMDTSLCVTCEKVQKKMFKIFKSAIKARKKNPWI